MNNLICFTVKISDGYAAFIVWNVFDEKEEFIKIIPNIISSWQNMNDIINIHLCNSLQEISKFPGFYEAFYSFCEEKVPSGNLRYKQWKEKKKKYLLTSNPYEFKYGILIKSAGFLKTYKMDE